jgi:hypothetical protein
MSITPGFTTEEIRQFVQEYLDLPHGQKKAWLQGKAFTADQFRRWRAAYLAGDLDRGLVPRSAGGRQQGVFARARAVEQELAAERAKHAAELARRDEQIATLEAGNVALGKAIGLLQIRQQQEPGAGTSISSDDSSKT